MDGIHDLGGKHGYGLVERDDGPAFHERWEAKVFAISRVVAATGANNNTDRFRHAVERIDPVAYLSHTYYGRWLAGIETLLVEGKVFKTEEITERALAFGASANDLVGARPSQTPDPLGDVEPAGTAARAIAAAPRFQPGDLIRTAMDVKPGHTRLPAYARGKLGRIRTCYAGWVFPDTNAHGLGEQPQHLYSVEFAGTQLWGEGADPSLRVYLDLFEPYLKPVQAKVTE